MSSMMRWIWIAMAMALAGCGSKKLEDPGPPCSKVADHVNEIAQQAYPGHTDMMPKNSRKAYIASCEQRKLTAKQRRCMLEAKNMDGLAECQRQGQKLHDDPAGTPAGAPAPAPTTPAPSGTTPTAPTPAPAAPAPAPTPK